MITTLILTFYIYLQISIVIAYLDITDLRFFDSLDVLLIIILMAFNPIGFLMLDDYKSSGKGLSWPYFVYKSIKKIFQKRKEKKEKDEQMKDEQIKSCYEKITEYKNYK